MDEYKTKPSLEEKTEDSLENFFDDDNAIETDPLNSFKIYIDDFTSMFDSILGDRKYFSNEQWDYVLYIDCYVLEAVFKSLVQRRGILKFVEWVKGNQIFVWVYC